MVIVIDNYDSFTYNLVYDFERLGYSVKVFLNDEVTSELIDACNPSHLCLSPGPGLPKDSGQTMKILSAYADKLPILGVCLGLQCIVEYMGGRLRLAHQIMHGKRSQVCSTGTGIFEGLEEFQVIRYHSWVADELSLPPEVNILARSKDDDEIMAIEVAGRNMWGVQYHPESILSEGGIRLLQQFLQVKI